MENPYTDSTDSPQLAGEEQLSAYVKRMDTDENLKKLAGKLKNELQAPAPAKKRDLSFEKFEKKRKESGQ